MKKDTIVSAKTVDEAVSAGAAELGTTAENVSYTVIEEPKKGFLGMGSSLAKVQVTYIYKPLEAARSFIETLMENLGITGEITVHDDGDGEALITISGESASALIGHHGDTLEAFQYLVNLAANKKDDEDRQYTRISIDIENYREKREEALTKLAARMAAKVKKTGRNVALEPMNAYERRIIHAAVQKIDGVSTNSVGAEGNRRVVIFPEGAEKPTEITEPQRSAGSSRGRRGGHSSDRRRSERRPAEHTEERPIPRRRPDAPRPTPRKIEKAKDLESYFAKLKEFSNNMPQ